MADSSGTVGGTLRGVVEAVHATLPCGAVIRNLSHLILVTEEPAETAFAPAVFAAFAAEMDATAFVAPPGGDPHVVHGGPTA